MFRQDWPIVTIITAPEGRKLHHGNTAIGANRSALACVGLRAAIVLGNKGIGTMKGIRSIVLGALLSVFTATTMASSGLVGQPTPDFALKSSSGDNVRLSEQRGDVVMINFWATWCAPCRQEMPLLDDLYARYERVGFTLLGVNIDDDKRRAMKMIEELGVNFPVLFDESKDVSRLYDVEVMPTTVLVDRNGTVRYIHHGYKPGYEDKYLTEIRSLLRE